MRIVTLQSRSILVDTSEYRSFHSTRDMVAMSNGPQSKRKLIETLIYLLKCWNSNSTNSHYTDFVWNKTFYRLANNLFGILQICVCDALWCNRPLKFARPNWVQMRRNAESRQMYDHKLHAVYHRQWSGQMYTLRVVTEKMIYRKRKQEKRYIAH